MFAQIFRFYSSMRAYKNACIFQIPKAHISIHRKVLVYLKGFDIAPESLVIP